MKSPSAVLIITTAILSFAGLVAPLEADELTLAQARMVRLQAICESGLVNLDLTLTAASDVAWRDAVLAWHERHADALAELHELQVRVAELTAPLDAAPLEEPPIPADAPASVRPALDEARTLRIAAAQVAYRWRDASAVEQRDAMRTWFEQNAIRLAANAERLRAATGPSNPPAVVPTTPPDLPPGLDPEIRRRVLERAALDAELANLTNQLRDASPLEQRDALRQWHESNEARLRQTIE